MIYYVIVLQDGNVLATCFDERAITLYDGAISIGAMSPKGELHGLHGGKLVNGEFKRD